MATMQNSFGKRKSGEITRSERSTVNQQVESVLKDLKEKTGEVIQIQITDRTSIELPAHFSQEQRDARVAKYLELHNSKI